MTETITLRLRRPKSELQAKARPNVNAWLNDLIDHALGPKKADWDEHFDWKKRQKPVAKYVTDEIRKRQR